MSAEIAIHLIRNDWRLIRRDRLLFFMIFFAFIIAIILRFLLPWLDALLETRGVLPNRSVPSRLSDFFPMIVTFFTFFNGAQISGSIFGFLLLDEKDQGTLSAIQVAPVPLNLFLLIRLLIPAVMGFVICAAMLVIVNQSLIPWWKILLVSLGASLLAPITALYLSTFAENKVHGFAIAKFVGVAGWTILFGWFVAEPLQWIFGIFPPFLVSKAYWMALEGRGAWSLVLAAGIVLQLGLIYWLALRFQRSGTNYNRQTVVHSDD